MRLYALSTSFDQKEKPKRKIGTKTIEKTVG